MTPEDLKALLEGSFAGLGPMIALTIGIVLLLLAEILPGAGEARPVIFLGTLVVAFLGEASILADAPGSVLGGSFVADAASAAWGMLFLIAALIAWVFGRGYYDEEKPFLGEHDVLMLSSTLGMLLMAGSGDLLSFFIGLELLSVPLYALSGFRRSRNRSVEAGLKYFLLGAFASALFLYGAALVYAGTGTISFEVLHDVGASDSLSLIGLALITSALFFKAGVFPFHFWVPDVYQGAPTPVTTFMATGTKAAAFAFLLNMAFLLPGAAATSLAWIALLTIAIGNLGALVSRDLKRMLALSGVAHAGILLLSVAGYLKTGDVHGAQQAAIYYMAAYVFSAGGAFGLLALLESKTNDTTTLESIKGLSSRHPGIAAAMAVFMLSLAGIPATGGFLGKYFVFSILVRADMLGVAVFAILLSVIALGYYLRVIIAMWMQPVAEDAPALGEPRPVGTVAAAVCVVMVLLLGVMPQLFLALLS